MFSCLFLDKQFLWAWWRWVGEVVMKQCYIHLNTFIYLYKYIYVPITSTLAIRSFRYFMKSWYGIRHSCFGKISWGIVLFLNAILLTRQHSCVVHVMTIISSASHNGFSGFMHAFAYLYSKMCYVSDGSVVSVPQGSCVIAPRQKYVLDNEGHPVSDHRGRSITVDNDTIILKVWPTIILVLLTGRDGFNVCVERNIISIVMGTVIRVLVQVFSHIVKRIVIQI